MKRHRSGWRSCATKNEIGPILHDLASLFDHVSAPVADGVYTRPVERLEKSIAEGPEFHGTDAQTEIVTAFGDLAGIWPAGILSNPQRAA